MSAASPKNRRWLRGLLAAAGLLLLTCLGVWLMLYSSVRYEPLPDTLPAEAWPPGFAALTEFPAQGPNQCGAYSLALALHGLTGQEPDRSALVNELVEVVSWSEALTGARPWTLVDAVRTRQLGEQGCSASDVPEARRLDLVRKHLAAGRPVILLLESARGIQHYVLALGYYPGHVALYDPAADRTAAPDGQTLDLNGTLAGNRSLTEGQLLALWARGGALGLFRWWYLPVGF